MSYFSRQGKQFFRRLDWRVIIILNLLMIISLLVISATTMELSDYGEASFWTSSTLSQMKYFSIGWIFYFLFALLDYRKLREWTWLLYVGMILLLLGLFFTTPIQNVRRWYRLPIVGGGFQPSEYAKLVMVISLSWFMEYKERTIRAWGSTWQALLIVLIPFTLILKQPDLGTALVLYPTALVMFYFGSIKKRVIATMSFLGIVSVTVSSLFFLGILPHEKMRPTFTTVLKEYQYERLNPDTYHQKAARTAIALGGVSGAGWRKSEFTGRRWLPAAHTDSVFSAYAEEFGLLGVFALLALFFGLIFFSFQVTLCAKDRFGRLLAAGITAFLAMHLLINMGMMSGFLPITGVPLILITYGGSSIVATMMALGILQSIYIRRFTF